MADSKRFTTALLNKKQVSKDAYSFYFKKNDFYYLPGQYIRLTLKIDTPDERGSSRFFTLSSSPTEEHLMITTRILQSAFKKTLTNLKREDEVSMFGPLGKFILKEDEHKKHVFLAGGIGITPYRAMIKYAVDRHLKIQITLFTSFKTVEDYAFRDFFHNVASESNWFKLVETITQPEESNQLWTGHRGRIDADLIRKNIDDLQNSLFFISGPPKMVDGLKEIVKSLNVTDDTINIEKFSGY